VHSQSVLVIDKANFLNLFIKKLTRDGLCHHSCQSFLFISELRFGCASLP